MNSILLRRSKNIKLKKSYVRPATEDEKCIDDMFYARMRGVRKVELIQKKTFDYIESLKRQGKWRTGGLQKQIFEIYNERLERKQKAIMHVDEKLGGSE